MLRCRERYIHSIRTVLLHALFDYLAGDLILHYATVTLYETDKAMPETKMIKNGIFYKSPRHVSMTIFDIRQLAVPKNDGPGNDRWTTFR